MICIQEKGAVLFNQGGECSLSFMSKNASKQIWVLAIGGFLITTVGIGGPAYAAPPEGRGSERAQEVANQGHGNGHSKDSSHSNHAAIIRDPTHGKHSWQPGSFNFHARKPGDSGEREFHSQNEQGTSSGRGVEASSLKQLNRTIVRDFENTLADLRKPEQPRWWNNAPFPMLDPYGHSRDDRKELYGNRGRPIRGAEPAPGPEPPPPGEEPPPPQEEPPPPPAPEPQYVTVTQETYNILQLIDWNGVEVTKSLLSGLGYTSQEVDFLLTLSLAQIQTALSSGGQILIP